MFKVFITMAQVVCAWYAVRTSEVRVLNWGSAEARKRWNLEKAYEMDMEGAGL